MDLPGTAFLALLPRNTFNGINCFSSFITKSTGKADSTYYGQLCEVSTEKPLKKGMFPESKCIVRFQRCFLGWVTSWADGNGRWEKHRGVYEGFSSLHQTFFVRAAHASAAVRARDAETRNVCVNKCVHMHARVGLCPALCACV